MKARLSLSGWVGAIGILTFLNARLHAAPLASCDESSLRAAIGAGGTIMFECDGTVVLSSTIVVGNDVSLDANGHTVVITGNRMVRLFDIRPGVSFSVKGVTLREGVAETGGAIFNDGGFISLVNCSLRSNTAVGTNGTMFLGGSASGGAIHSRGGTLAATSCVFSNNQVRGGKGGSFHPFPGGGCGGSVSGGAIYHADGDAALTNCSFARNETVAGAGGDSSVISGGCGGWSWGGAITLSNGAVTIIGTLFESNRVFGGDRGSGSLGMAGPGGNALGGSIATLNAIAYLSNCTFNANAAAGGLGGRASAGGFAYGGGVYTQGGSIVFGDSVFINNSARAGFGQPEGPSADALGGGLWVTGDGTATQVKFAGNVAIGADAGHRQTEPGGSAKGGALYNVGTFVVTESALLSNRAVGGGGAYREGTGSGAVRGGDGAGGALHNVGSLWLTNVTIAFNAAVGGPGAAGTFGVPPGPPGYSLGGALYNAGTAELVHATLVHNGGTGGVIHAAMPIGVLNSIIAYPEDGANCSGQIIDRGHNISSDRSCNFNAPGSLNDADPSVGVPGDHGGPTPTAPLLVGSPGLDAAAASSCPGTDQRGEARPQGARCDIGAFEARAEELKPILTVEFAGIELMISLLGRPFTEYRLLTSGNLKQWTNIATTSTDASGRALFHERRDTLNRFYYVTVP